MKINLACQGRKPDGYVNIDLNEQYKPDVRADVRDLSHLYSGNTIEEILAYHILEHFFYQEARAAVKHWYKLLKPNGRLFVIVPDIAKMIRMCVSNDISVGELSWGMLGFDKETASDLDRHKFLYDEKRLEDVLQACHWKSMEVIPHSHAPHSTDAGWQLAVKCIK